MPENGGEFSSAPESFRSHIPIYDRYSGANFRQDSRCKPKQSRISATAHGKSQLDYTLESRDPLPPWAPAFAGEAVLSEVLHHRVNRVNDSEH
jgi:hypothetical protein